jgi:hypothetical protein
MTKKFITQIISGRNEQMMLVLSKMIDKYKIFAVRPLCHNAVMWRITAAVLSQRKH